MFTPELQEAKMAELPSVNLTEIEKMEVIAYGSQDDAVFMLNLTSIRMLLSTQQERCIKPT